MVDTGMEYLGQKTNITRCLMESTQTVIVLTAWVKVDERGGQGHTSASLLHQSAM
jgi:hypothetical protein